MNTRILDSVNRASKHVTASTTMSSCKAAPLQLGRVLQDVGRWCLPQMPREQEMPRSSRCYPQMNREAHRGPYVKDSSFRRAQNFQKSLTKACTPDRKNPFYDLRHIAWLRTFGSFGGPLQQLTEIDLRSLQPAEGSRSVRKTPYLQRLLSSEP